MATVLITGGAGFIGRHCANKFLKKGWDVRLLDIVSIAKNDPILNPGYHALVGDIGSLKAVKSAMHGCDAVIHLAAIVSVPKSIQEPEKTMQVNVDGTKNVLECAKVCGVSKILVASSAAVYGDGEHLPIEETAPSIALSPYGESKIINERDVNSARSGGLNALALRFFNVYGPGQNQTSGYASVIPNFVEKMTKCERPTIFGDGLQTRDFIHVSDLVDAMYKLCIEKLPFKHSVVNVSTQTQTTVLDVVETINQHLEAHRPLQQIKPIHTPPRPGDIMHSYGSNSRLKSMIRWTPRTELSEGISSLIHEATDEGES
jgi:nucleoside-diphosphate-sugar epimerase